MEPNFSAFQEKFRVDQLKIVKTEFWTWSVRPVHSTLGAGILSLNRYCEKLSLISEKEGADFSHIAKLIENTLQKTFQYNKMNYLMLMMVDHHLHYHVIPRYDSARNFAGQEWVDQGWPALPVLQGEVPSDNTLFEIRDILTKNVR
jgi:diadenosine tetraphosphate (Ap4A) HIT family hydrolase